MFSIVALPWHVFIKQETFSEKKTRITYKMSFKTMSDARKQKGLPYIKKLIKKLINVKLALILSRI